MLTVSGEQVSFRTRKHLALLIRLALEPGKQFTRDYLADLLWPSAAPQLANHSLAQGLSVIKAKIAREAVVIQRATVGLAPGWIDVDVNHLPSNDVTIDGPFLDAFEIGSARPFEDWKDEFRARLAPQLRDCLVRQMDAARRIGDFPTVQRHAERLQDLDPLAEEAIRGIMEARAWASDRSGALKVFARYEAKLAEELEARPSPDLLRMADLLRDGRRSAQRGSVPGCAPERADRRFEPETLIGREKEFSVLSDAWQDVRQKSSRIVVVTSDPGVGKTTLVNAFASSCQMDGAVVVRAQAYEAERELPFAVLGELVKQLAAQRAIGTVDPAALSELTRISTEVLREYPGVPKPVEWSPELMPLRIADAFLKTVTTAAADSPIVLVVDDVHAADNASTAILHSVGRKLGNIRVLLILAGRSNELRLSSGPWALTSDAVMDTRQLDLEVLSPSSATQLVHRLSKALSRREPPIERILRASGCNPLAIELLAREWAEHGDGSLLHDLEALDTQPVQMIGIPRAIGVVFDRQTRRLEADVRATLDLAAILGRRLIEVSLYAAVELTAGTAVECLSRLRDEGYLREVSGQLEFRNELIRAQAYYAIAATARQHLHQRAAELLAGSHWNLDRTIGLEIAWHHLRGGDVNRALPFAIEGVEAALAIGAPQGAEEILRAIINSDSKLQENSQIQLLLAKSLIDQSKAESALPIVEKLAVADELSLHQQAEVAMLRASAEFVLSTGIARRYCEAAKAALAAAKRTNDPQLVGQALFECARAGTEEGQAELLQGAEREVDDLAKTVNIDRLPMANLTKAYCRFFLGDPSGARIRLTNMLRTSERNANAAQLALIHSGLGVANHFLARFDDAYQEHLAALDLTRKVGDDARACTIAANLCTVLTNRGDFAEAIRFGKMSVNTGEASSCSTLLVAYTNLIDPYMLLGQEGAALECLEKGASLIGPDRRWKLRLAFLIEAASLALMRHNLGLALDLIGQLEGIVHGREIAIPAPGAYWKLKTLRMAHLGRWDEAHDIASTLVERWRSTYVFPYLDMIAAKAWLEQRRWGTASSETSKELGVFERTGAKGKRELLTLQGFLEPLRENHLGSKRGIVREPPVVGSRIQKSQA